MNHLAVRPRFLREPAKERSFAHHIIGFVSAIGFLRRFSATRHSRLQCDRADRLFVQGLIFVVLTLLFTGNSHARERDNEQVDVFAILVEQIGQTNNADVQASLLRGMLAGLEGRRNVPVPDGWIELSKRLSEHVSGDDNQQVRQLSLRLSQIFGDQEAAAKALATLQDSSANTSLRRDALHSLLGQRSPDVFLQLETLLGDDELAIDAIRGYAVAEVAAAPSVLLTRYSKYDRQRKRAVIETLATRKPYASRLIGAIERGTVPREDIPIQVARSLQDLMGDRFTKTFGEVPTVGKDREKLLKQYKALATPKAIAAASESRGRTVFAKTCAACHKLYGEGGDVGPDLTGSNRANLDYILLNSVDPSYDVPYAYKMVQILTNEGRVINGVLAEEDDVRVVLKTAEQPRVVIAKSDIETRRLSKKSMMPDGQLDQMNNQEVVDLIKYLRTTKQVEMAQ